MLNIYTLENQTGQLQFLTSPCISSVTFKICLLQFSCKRLIITLLVEIVFLVCRDNLMKWYTRRTDSHPWTIVSPLKILAYCSGDNTHLPWPCDFPLLCSHKPWPLMRTNSDICVCQALIWGSGTGGSGEDRFWRNINCYFKSVWFGIGYSNLQHRIIH